MRKSANPAVLRREQMQTERTRSAALRDVFPGVAQLRIGLVFTDAGAHTPSPQQHTLYAPAPAFFRFACPCTDCDGDYDLSAAVAKLLETASARSRANASASGTMPCHGVRLRDRAGNKACTMSLAYQLTVVPPNAE